MRTASKIAAIMTVAVAFGGLGWWLGPTQATPSSTHTETRSRPRPTAGARPADGRRVPAVPRAPTAPAPSAPIELTPGAPGYDAVRTSEWLGLSPSEVFDREPVDVRWAPAMEHELQGIVGDGMVAGGFVVAGVTTTCRTACCQISIETSAADQRFVVEFFQTSAPLGSTMAFSSEALADGRVRVVFSTMYDNPTREPSTFRTLVRQRIEQDRDAIAAWKRQRDGQ